MGTSRRSKPFAARATWHLLLALALAVATTLSASGPALAAVEPSAAAVTVSKKGGEPGASAAPTPTPTPDIGIAPAGGKGQGKGDKPTPIPTPTPTPVPTLDPTPTPDATPTPTPAPTIDATVATQTGSCKITSLVIDANSKQSVLRPGDTIAYTVRWQTSGKCSGATVTWSTDQPGGSFSGSTTGSSSGTTTFTAGNALGSNWRITVAVSVKPGNDTKSDSRFVDVKLDSSLAASAASGRVGTTATLSATLTSGATALAGRTISFGALGTTLTATTDAAGTAAATLSLATATAGSYSYTATFAGDTQYRAAGASAALIVTPADTTPPVVSAIVTGTRGAGDWYVGDVLVTWAVADPESTIASQTGCGAASVTADTAAVTFQCSAVSLGGTTAIAVTVARDATAPTIDAARTPSNDFGWTNGDVVVTFTCADALSGLVTCSAPVTLAAEGAAQAVTGNASDRAGNTSSRTVRDINIDRTAPTITGARTAPNGFGWNNTDVTVAFTCADGLSGIASCTAPIVIAAEGADQSAAGSARDRADNGASTAVSGINVDKTPPTIAASRTPANPNGWNGADVTVTFSCEDSLSGVASCSSPVVLVAEGAGQRATGSAQDSAGNTASASATGINIDKTAPTIVGTRTAANASGWNNDDVVVAFACADALSGVESCGSAAVLSGEGTSQSVTRDATDLAGNTARTTVADINIDRTRPAIAFSGNEGTYGVDATVAITCAATDTLSGVATSTCPSVASAPAYSFVAANPTVVTRSAIATDRAGNTTSVSTSFTVTVTYSGLCSLTRSFSTSATVGESLCAQLSAAATAKSKGAEIAAGKAIASYQDEVRAQIGRAFTSEQAATLVALSSLL